VSKLDDLESSVSRETLQDLRLYEAELLKWTKTINLISHGTVEHSWQRHIMDSVQLWPLIGPARRLVDLGSGGGLPGIPIAILAKHHGTVEQVTLVESDGRKAIFLKEVARKLKLNCRVLTERVERVAPQNADICTARALSSLSALLEFAHRHLAPTGRAYFLKGSKVDTELQKAKENWDFSLKAHRSITDPNGSILEIEGVRLWPTRS